MNTRPATHTETLSTVAPCPSKYRTAIGLFFLVLAVYILSSPGRIDIIDGQARFDVTYNWVTTGHPVLTDSWIRPFMSVKGRGGIPYSFYGAPASILSMPLVALGVLYDDPGRNTSQFLFSLTSPILGAMIAPVLFLFYIELGISPRKALLWTFVSSFATMVWPASTSSFDNAQHAFFALTGIYFGYLSSKRNSRLLAIAGGLTASVLVLYQEYFLLIIPALACSTLNNTSAAEGRHTIDSETTLLWTTFISKSRRLLRVTFRYVRTALCESGNERDSCVRFLLWTLTAMMVSVLLSCSYNNLRFGSFFLNGKLKIPSHNSVSFFGNPVPGFLTLTVSPGKSIFLYSSTVLIGIFGIRRFWRRYPQLFLAISLGSLVLLLFLSCISFAGGDWCWGPRYLVILLPLWALLFPFVRIDRVLQRRAVVLVVASGLLVQVLALATENQRFFFERKLDDFFWAEDPWFYLKHSALFARPKETIALLDGPPAEAMSFNAIPIPDWYTYTILGPPVHTPRSIAPLWMRHFKVFYLPRPWPLWMAWTDPDLRPINMRTWVVFLSGLGVIGIVLFYPVLHPPKVVHPLSRAMCEEVGAF